MPGDHAGLAEAVPAARPGDLIVLGPAPIGAASRSQGQSGGSRFRGVNRNFSGDGIYTENVEPFARRYLTI